MKLLVFGLTISSSWGNGHATLWRGLCRALAVKGHRVVFFERDVPYYASTRDYTEIPGGELVLYSAWEDVCSRAACEINDADAAIVTSYCPDALAATRMIVDDGGPRAVFYDLDAPITLARLNAGETVDYIPGNLADFDLVLSYAGGSTLDQLRFRLGARQVEPLYGHVDPDIHHRVTPIESYRADLSYLGTFSSDRQSGLDALFLTPARERPEKRFVIGGAQYPTEFPWSKNIYFVRHLPPDEHPSFYSSSRVTLNLTRRAMAELGWCPSGRLFEAAACGVPVLSDEWPGLDTFFTPGIEILVSRGPEDTIKALDLGNTALRKIGEAARERVYAEHTSAHRASQLIQLLEPRSPRSAPPAAAAAWG
jgi:spore maturation protein CgeB